MTKAGLGELERAASLEEERLGDAACADEASAEAGELDLVERLEERIEEDTSFDDDDGPGELGCAVTRVEVRLGDSG